MWTEEATRGCTTCCCSAEFAGAVRGAVVFSAIAGGPALASAGDAETDTVAGKYVDRSWEYINNSQIHECRN
jgi:hypothetical protein